MCPSILMKSATQYIDAEMIEISIYCREKNLKERNGRHRLDITVNRIRRRNSGKSNVVKQGRK